MITFNPLPTNGLWLRLEIWHGWSTRQNFLGCDFSFFLSAFLPFSPLPFFLSSFLSSSSFSITTTLPTPNMCRSVGYASWKIVLCVFFVFIFFFFLLCHGGILYWNERCGLNVQMLLLLCHEPKQCVSQFDRLSLQSSVSLSLTVFVSMYQFVTLCQLAKILVFLVVKDGDLARSLTPSIFNALKMTISEHLMWLGNMAWNLAWMVHRAIIRDLEWSFSRSSKFWQ